METRQAGESLECDCGTKIAVPTLRQLRQLPLVPDQTVEVAGSTWGPRQRVIALNLMLGGVCVIAAAVSHFSERPVPKIDSIAYSQKVDRAVSDLTPLQAWERWIDTYQPLVTTGFEVYKHPATGAMQRVLDWHRWIQKGLLAVAVVCVAMAVVLGCTGRGTMAA